MIKTVYNWSMVIFMCMTVAQPSIAQPAVVDSLKRVVQNDVNPDTNTVKNLIKIAARTYRGMPDTAKIYAERAISLSQEIGFLKGEAEGNRYFGAALNTEGKMDSALIYYVRSLEIHKENRDMRGIAGAQAGVGIVYAVQKQFKEAVFYFIEATKTYELLKNYTALSVMYNNIGNLYLEQEQFEAAYENYVRALDALEKGGNMLRASLIYGNTAIVLKELGRLKEALSFVELGLTNAREYNDRRMLASLYMNSGTIRQERNEFEAALDEYENAITIFRELGNEIYLTESLFYRAQVKVRLGKREEAKEELAAVISRFDDKNVYNPRLQSNAYELLARLELEVGEPSKAGEYALLAKTISDSLYKEENLKAISEIETKYETEKKEQEIKLLESETESAQLKLVLGLSIAFGLLIIISVSYWQISKRRKRERELELQTVQRELSRYGVLMAEKDSFLTIIIDRLKDLGNSLKTIDSKKELDSIVDELKHNTKLTDNEDQLFQRIEQVNSGFFTELDNRFEDLSKAEKRLASLVEMELSNKEIGGILSINARSVVQARYRLKKKLNTGEKDLVEFLKELA